ncbi:MAG: hypothetical protein O2923_03930 [Verrucomicrobia bacterium]|nr:hypothetical protein [Verrucomicrobiota bacterium]MDA1086373.1 hypothetical protein [Verrucomicrobiota bacterium]
MPDIELTCAACDNTLTISEYATPENLKCPSCGADMALSNRAEATGPADAEMPKGESSGNVVIEPPDPSRRRASVARRPARSAAAGDAAAGAGARVVAEVQVDSEKARKSRTRILGPGVISAIILLIIGLPLAWYRYAGPIDPGMAASLDRFGDTWGPPILLAFHIIILLEAYRDEFFFGVMSTIVPLYSFVYLYTRSDNQVVRVVFSLFVVVFALPMYDGTIEYLGSAYETVNAFIAQSDREAGFE